MTIPLKYDMISPMFMDLERRRIIECQKAKCREKIDFHTKNVILQSIVSLLCVTSGFYAGTKKSIVVPLVIYPAASVSILKLTEHEAKRKKYQKLLNRLERS